VTNTLKSDKIAGAIFGFAIGDAMGATTEFMTDVQIQKTYGKVVNIIGGGWLNLKAGQITDDTQMSMCIMEAIMSTNNIINCSREDEIAKEFIQNVSNNFINWYKSNPIDIGAQCSRGIRNLIQGAKTEIEPTALGNGSLMRALPCSLLGLFNCNVLQGRLTHNNLKCDQIVSEYSRLIQNHLDGNLLMLNIKGLMEPSGYIVNTYNNALYWSSNFNFEDAIIGAVNHGGDADTIGAITGSLSGAKYGYSAIPLKWINQLDQDTKNSLNIFINFVIKCLQI